MEGCETPRLFESFVAAMKDDTLDASDATAEKKENEEESMAEGKKEWKREDVEWARNKTVVLFGDSVARENIVYFCEVRPPARLVLVARKTIQMHHSMQPVVPADAFMFWWLVIW